MKTIYIAGKVTGEQIAQCTLKFGSAQKQLEDLGYKAVNPLAVVNDWHTTWENAMRKCIKALMECDAIYAMPCCGESEGASIELRLAAALKIPVYKNIKTFKTDEKRCPTQKELCINPNSCNAFGCHKPV